jgi:thiol-disulfide isomerase/thioredoxin
MSSTGRFVAVGVLAAIVVVTGLIFVTRNDDASSSSPGPVITATSAGAEQQGADAGPSVQTDAPAEVATTTALPDVPELPDRGLHEPLAGIDGWLQSEVTSLDELRGKVVAVQFWTGGCSNCKATLPHMQALYEKYGGDDFEIVGVHAPEFSFEEDPANVAAAADDLGVTWPIALDTNKKSFFGWQGGRGFWPHVYLLDRDGHVRYDHIGEGGYATTDAAVGALLAEQP